MRDLLAGLLMTVAFVLGVEGISRWLAPVSLPDPVDDRAPIAWRNLREYDPLLFWRLKPRVQGGESIVNSLGLRGAEIPPKADDEFRVLSLGESTTFGADVDFDATYSALLAQLLPCVDGKRVRVINAGVPGYSLFQGVSFLHHRAEPLRPDAVILYFGFNDFLPTGYRVSRDAEATDETAGFTDREIYESRNTLSYRLVHGLAKHSNVVRLLAFREREDLEIRQNRSRPRVPPKDRRQLLAAAVELSQQRGWRLVLAVPWYRSFTKHEALLRDFATKNEVALIDLPYILEMPAEQRARYFRDRVHPTAEGHERIARALAGQLEDVWDTEKCRF